VSRASFRLWSRARVGLMLREARMAPRFFEPTGKPAGSGTNGGGSTSSVSDADDPPADRSAGPEGMCTAGCCGPSRGCGPCEEVVQRGGLARGLTGRLVERLLGGRAEVRIGGGFRPGAGCGVSTISSSADSSSAVPPCASGGAAGGPLGDSGCRAPRGSARFWPATTCMATPQSGQSILPPAGRPATTNDWPHFEHLTRTASSYPPPHCPRMVRPPATGTGDEKKSPPLLSS